MNYKYAFFTLVVLYHLKELIILLMEEKGCDDLSVSRVSQGIVRPIACLLILILQKVFLVFYCFKEGAMVVVWFNDKDKKRLYTRNPLKFFYFDIKYNKHRKDVSTKEWFWHFNRYDDLQDCMKKGLYELV